MYGIDLVNDLCGGAFEIQPESVLCDESGKLFWESPKSHHGKQPRRLAEDPGKRIRKGGRYP